MRRNNAGQKITKQTTLPLEIKPKSNSPTYHLRSVIVHIGSSLDACHYVCFVRKINVGDACEWILIDDEKITYFSDLQIIEKYCKRNSNRTPYVAFYESSVSMPNSTNIQDLITLSSDDE